MQSRRHHQPIGRKYAKHVLTNGYVSSMCMIAAPSLAHNPRLRGREDVDASSTLAGFFLVGGLALGSAASFVVRAKICSCNPFVD